MIFWKSDHNVRIIIALLCIAILIPVSYADDSTRTITDALGRTVIIPQNPDSVICSGSGCLRYLTYLQGLEKVIGVDDIEIKNSPFESRPYALAHPELATLPVFGEFRGIDDPEKIVMLDPDVIFKVMTTEEDADELAAKTGIPVVALNYGDLFLLRTDMNQALRIMGDVIGASDRAEEVIAFFEERIEDLNSRTAEISEDDKKNVYVGGVSYAGAHGIVSTDAGYPPFLMVNAKNLAGNLGIGHVDVAKEQVIDWNPDILFVDLGTLQLQGERADVISEIADDPSFAIINAVSNHEIFGLLPYNYYNTNQGSVIADAYYVGKILYPKQFEDINPESEADEIYEFLVGKNVFSQLNQNAIAGLGFTHIDPASV